MKRLLIAAIFLAACPVYSQEAVETEAGQGAVLRAIDTINGKVEDLSIPSGQTQSFGRIDITLTECRYPAANPFEDAFAQMEINENSEQHFKGWMLASSPALNAMEHPRYDVWVINCIIE